MVVFGADDLRFRNDLHVQRLDRKIRLRILAPAARHFAASHLKDCRAGS